MALRLTALVLAAALMSGGCARRAIVTSSELQDARVSTGAWIREELYFGLNKPAGGLVSEEEFLRFTEREIATRLPAGFTILDGIGYWRNARGVTERERSRVLIVYYRDTERDKPKLLGEIVAVYKRLFAQEAVLRVVLPAKVMF